MFGQNTLAASKTAFLNQRIITLDLPHSARATNVIVVFPPSPRTARHVANRLRCHGFYSLPERTWSNAADLAEYLIDEEPTDAQRIWLWGAYERFLQ